MLLGEAVREYNAYRRTTDLAANTLRASEATLRQFVAVVGSDVPLALVGHLETARFFEQGAETRGTQSQRNDFSRLSTFFAYCRARGHMSPDQDPLFGRRRPKRVKRERDRVHVSKFPALLDCAETRDARDRAAVAVLLFTLARDQEVASLRIRDVDLAAGFVKVMVHKTQEEDRVPICAELDRELRRWLTIYAERVGTLQPHYYLLPARVTRPRFEAGRIVAADLLTYNPTRKTRAAGDIASPALQAIGFPIRDESGKGLGEGAHTIRRSGARALYERLAANGHDNAIRVVQSLLHHASMSQTEDYIGLTLERKTRNELMRGQELYGLPAPNRQFGLTA